MQQRRVKLSNVRSLMMEVLGSENSARELRSYLLAIQSYGDQLASQPDLSFQQHLANIITAEYRMTGASVTREN
jgi:hypothetical protein